MKSEDLTFLGANNTPLHAKIWEPDTTPLAILQISHGMIEHMGRYEGIASKFVSEGIVVAGFDLRGHGMNPGQDNIASLGETGWEDSIEDISLFQQEIHKRYPGVPCFLLGFSLGSFLVREYLNGHDDGVAGAILIGTGNQPACILSILKRIVKREINKVGFDGVSDTVNKLSFRAYNKKFSAQGVPMSWFCEDNEQRITTLTDELTKRYISAGTFWLLLDSMDRTGRKSAYNLWNKNVPVLLLSGADDPVSSSGTCLKKIQKAMLNAGISDVTSKIFPGRHGLLYENQNGSAEKAQKEIISWMLKHRNA